ncbi:MAG: PQQ-binding-like beta-propeller repeat protein [Myxococcota bacterium]
MRGLAVVVALAGCAGDPVKDPDGAGGYPTDPTLSDTTPSDTTPAGCGGDLDGDGIDDCDDRACTLELPGAGAVAVRPDCEGDVPVLVPDPWRVREAWSDPSGGPIVGTPVTGQLTDDNGDGVIDADDVPDVAYVSFDDGTLSIASADGSGVHCTLGGFDHDGGVLIADVDGDGVNEVVADTTAYEIVALDGACDVEWTSVRVPSLLYPVPTAADLDGDGVVEIVFDRGVLDGRTGAVLAELEPADGDCWRAPYTGDLDQDGVAEIVLGNTVFDADGTVRWSLPGAGASCFGGAVDLDGDPEAELFFAYGDTLSVVDHDGAPRWSAPLAAANPGAPCAGDIDADGEAEIVVPNGTALTAFAADGQVQWSVPMTDYSGSAGCALFDLDGDLAYEVLVNDEVSVRIIDGRTGAVRWEDGSHASITYMESPVVADVDHDGAAELLVANSGTGAGLTVYRHAGGAWPAAGDTWGLPDYSGSNQAPDGSIPMAPQPTWQADNLFRGRPHEAVLGAPNLAAEVTGVCASSCVGGVGVVDLGLVVRNDGALPARATTAALYVVDAAGAEALAATVAVPAVDPGQALPGLTFEVPVQDWTGAYVVRLDDDGTRPSLGECDEGDNAVAGEAAVCP